MTVTLSISGEKINKTFIGKSVDDVLNQANRFFIYVPPHTPIPPVAKEPHGNPEHTHEVGTPTEQKDTEEMHGHELKTDDKGKEHKPHPEKKKDE